VKTAHTVVITRGCRPGVLEHSAWDLPDLGIGANALAYVHCETREWQLLLPHINYDKFPWVAPPASKMSPNPENFQCCNLLLGLHRLHYYSIGIHYPKQYQHYEYTGARHKGKTFTKADGSCFNWSKSPKHRALPVP